jgi:hypothetical protein
MPKLMHNVFFFELVTGRPWPRRKISLFHALKYRHEGNHSGFGVVSSVNRRQFMPESIDSAGKPTSCRALPSG